ncbi:MAG: hypothetical protein H0T84_13100 [Tatlockia sp.]|nr:hypothetical protein [Tatlockia sp.]
MDKKYFSPLELIKIATQHAYCAEYLLQDNAEIILSDRSLSDNLAPFVSLMYMAFELTLKAFLVQAFKTNNQYKNLIELIELCSDLAIPNQDVHLLKNLSRQYAFRKGVDYELWEDRQQLLVFCTDILDLYERIQELMPLELQKDYHSHAV